MTADHWFGLKYYVLAAILSQLVGLHHLNCASVQDSLERFAPPTHPRVPQLIVDCVAEIERRGLQEVRSFKAFLWIMWFLPELILHRQGCLDLLCGDMSWISSVFMAVF